MKKLFLIYFIIGCFTSYALDKSKERIITKTVDFNTSKVWKRAFWQTTKSNHHIGSDQKNIKIAESEILNSTYVLDVFPNHAVTIDDKFEIFKNQHSFYEITLSVLANRFKLTSNGLSLLINRSENQIKIKNETWDLSEFEFPLHIDVITSQKTISVLVNRKELMTSERESVNGKVKIKFTEGKSTIEKINKGYFREITIVQAIENYKSQKEKEWMIKGKYEKTITYQKRVDTDNIAIQKKKWESEIVNQLAKDMISCKAITNVYNADKEIFTLYLKGLNPIFVRIPINKAKDLNDDFCFFRYENAIYTFENDKFVLESTELVEKSSGKRFYGFKEFLDARNYNKEKFEDVSDSMDDYISKRMSTRKNYALIISVSDYQDDAITDLVEPVNDGKALAEVLKRKYTFYSDDIIELRNPTRSQLIDEFDRISKLITEEDNLLVFYAGHGIWDQTLKVGYWLPSDARENSRSQWFSNSLLRDYIGGINSHHTLLIADACFSGSIFKTREAFQDQKGILMLSRLPSRKAITSGAMTTVPDKSVFMEYLIKRLDENTAKTLSSSSLFNSFRIAVINNSPNNQIPLYGDIKETGDEGGDFIFIQQ